MEQLLSGFIGALIATLLSVFYLYISEQSKLRSEVLLEVVAYCDDLYDRLQNIHVHKNGEYAEHKAMFTDDEYRQISREISSLLKSRIVHAKLAIAYGEGNILASLNSLIDDFGNATSILRKATRSNWFNEHKEIMGLFSQKIDPGRVSLEKALINGIRPIPIIKSLKAKMF